ncbi:MAG: HlyD family secretion protein [Smithella sp.]|jgi:membrane fusion protein (multidrug efflux system)
MKKWGFRIFAIAAITAVVIYGMIYFIHSLSHESTDDAIVSGTIVPIAAEIKGRVTNVFVTDNQYVEQGKPLLEIYQQDYLNHFDESSQSLSRLDSEENELKAVIVEKEKGVVRARANLDVAVNEEDLALKELQRYEKLLNKEAVSQNEYDQFHSRWLVAVARKRAAEAAVAEAEVALQSAKTKTTTQSFKIKEAQSLNKLTRLDLTRTVVTAPVSGLIAMKNVDPGKYVMPGQALLSIVKEDIWVIANFKETQIAKMTVGQPVEIEVDAYPSIKFKGHVDSLQPGTGSIFSLLPPENATGSFIKVVQRIPVKITLDSKFDPNHPLWPGLSVIPTVDVSRATGTKLSIK